MRLFGVIVLAALLSCVVGLGVTLAAQQLIACRSDPAGCGLGQAYQVFLVPPEALIAAIVFGISAAGKGRERAVKIAMIALVALSVLLFVFGLASDANSGRRTQLADLLEALQIALPFWAIVATQWLLVRFFLRWRERQGALGAIS